MGLRSFSWELDLIDFFVFPHIVGVVFILFAPWFTKGKASPTMKAQANAKRRAVKKEGEFNWNLPINGPESGGNSSNIVSKPRTKK